MQELREILHGRNLHTLKQSVLRAMLIQEANRWILERNPLLATRARVRTQIGDILTVQCANGLVSTEIRLLEEQLLAHLHAFAPTLPLAGLKCFSAGSRMFDDQEP